MNLSQGYLDSEGKQIIINDVNSKKDVNNKIEDNIDYNNSKDEILKKLLERREKQNKYIADAFKGSRNEKADSLLVPLDSGN